MKNSEFASDSLKTILENMVSEALLAKSVGLDIQPSQIVAASYEAIKETAISDMQIASLLDNSDVLFHAEGPGATNHFPSLSSLNWLTSTVERSLRAMSKAWIDFKGENGKQASKLIDLRLSGFAPGSIWIGTKLLIPECPVFPDDEDVSMILKDAFWSLPELATFIGNDRILDGSSEVFSDPALRDIAFGVLLSLSPTGNKGIHSLDLIAQKDGAATLSMKDRTVLREYLKKPYGENMRSGTFAGEVRSVDLDKTRFHLRTRDGAIRCALDSLDAEQARKMLGRSIKVSGKYLANNEGRPTFISVKSIEETPSQVMMYD